MYHLNSNANICWFFSQFSRSAATAEHDDARNVAATYDGANEPDGPVCDAAPHGAHGPNAAVHAYAGWNTDDAANDGRRRTVPFDVSGWGTISQHSTAGGATETDIPRLQVCV